MAKRKIAEIISKVKKEKKSNIKLKEKQERLQKLAAKSSQRKPRGKVPYSNDDFILLVGEEGNFSFSASLAYILHSAERIIATCYDTEQVLLEKYPDVKENSSAITEMDGKVFYGVDATQLEKSKDIKNRKFTKIIFNFPHVGAGITNVEKNILANQKLIRDFLNSAQKLLTSEPFGEIHITLKSGEPYDSWNVKQIARECNLQCLETFAFDPLLYEGYTHRRTLGFSDSKSAANNEEILKKQCKTMIFTSKNAPNSNTKHYESE